MKRAHIRWPLIVGAAATGLAAYAAYVKSPGTAARTSIGTAVITRSETGTKTAEPSAGRRTDASRPYYNHAIREDMFSGPKPPEPPSAPPPTRPVSRVVVSSPPPVDPLSDAVYAGSMTVHGQTCALIESRATREGSYIAPGGSWQNIPVVAVTPGTVTLEVNGVERTLPVSDTINVVQLSASAPGMVSSPADQAKRDKKAANAAARAEKKLRAAVKKAAKQHKKREKKAQQALEEELSGLGNL